MAGARPPPGVVFNFFSGQNNVAFITPPSTSNYSLLPEKQSISRHAILAFGFSNLLNILQLKYQGKSDSPFDTHPVTTRIAIISFLVYFFLVYWLGYDAELAMIPTTTTTRIPRTCTNVLNRAVRLFGYVSLAAFSSILFTEGPIQSAVCLILTLLLFLLMYWVQNRNSPGTTGGVYNSTSTRRTLENRFALPV